MFAQGARKGTPLPLSPSFSPTHATTGCANRMCSSHSFTHHSRSGKRSPFASSQTRMRTCASGHAGIHCIGGAEKYVPTFPPPLSLQHSPSPCCRASPALYTPLLIAAPCFPHALLFPRALEVGVCAANDIRMARAPFPPAQLRFACPLTPLVCSRTPCPCLRVRRSPRAQNRG